MIINFTIAGVMINTSVHDWTINPVVTSIDSPSVPNSEVDFPAITTCKEMPSHHKSWEMPTLILDSIDFLNCSDGCNEKKLTQTKTAFDDFVGELVDKHIAADFYSEMKYLEGAACAPECVGQKIPGAFSLPKGYNGE